MYLEAINIILLIHAVTSISVASTPSSYTSAPSDSNYAAPSTLEPTIDYKSNGVHNQFPYARQFFEPVSPLSNPYAENLQSFNQLTPKPYLFHRTPFFPSAPYTGSAPYTDPQPTPYNLHGYLPQQQYAPLTDYPNQPFYDQQYPIAFQQKFGKSPLTPDCDFHPLNFRNTRPLLFRPYKLDNYLEQSPLLAKPANPLYRFQPSPLGVNLANNIYH
ncbi:hypothetical protein V9T40_003376 [Parthenolecanium corni]|uniref:Uncharacterized protein n=1 Tax=Parthenolecanium corni TaxID=536013 RepID=A0AAN9YA37_9HEMI